MVVNMETTIKVQPVSDTAQEYDLRFRVHGISWPTIQIVSSDAWLQTNIFALFAFR